jgi:hypothetical protein
MRAEKLFTSPERVKYFAIFDYKKAGQAGCE